MEGEAPLVESIEGDSTNSWVTYIWRGDDATRCVNIQGGPASLSGDSIKWLMRLAGTNLWYRTERVPKDARYKYAFMINRPMRIPQDPKAEAELIESLYKPDQFSPHDGLVELPDAPPQPWIHRLPGVAEGKTAEQTIHSEVLKDDRKIVVYTPPGYDSNSDACGLLILFDGQGYNLSTYIPGPVILDNLIEKQKIPPLVAVFVQQYERNKELGCSELFAEFIAKELVPRVRANYRVSTDPKRAMVGGLSLGGVMASYCSRCITPTCLAMSCHNPGPTGFTRAIPTRASPPTPSRAG